jgi:hypothetical protein
MKRIRIKGLVSLMNHARKQLANGIPESEAQAFRQIILDGTTFVERLCHEKGLAISSLPAPSRRAYVFLKGIDLDDLPILPDHEVIPVSIQRISGIVASSKGIQREFTNLTKAKLIGRMDDAVLEERLAALVHSITELAGKVEEICEKGNATPDDLPDPTRRAYQWLKFLSDPGNFQGHFRTLMEMCRRLPKGSIELYNLAGLYRLRISRGVRHIVLNEAFMDAPASIIEDLMVIVRSKAGRTHKTRIQRYAETEEFREIVLAMEMSGVRSQERVRGTTYDLDDVFKRVNDRYFEGRMEKPVLTWNRIITHAKFGHYIPTTDTVMVSIALDASDVPPYVLDHVMHHELLHKKLGIKVVNGRRLVHTPEFRSEEQRFEYYHKAQAFLNKLAGESS